MNTDYNLPDGVTSSNPEFSRDTICRCRICGRAFRYDPMEEAGICGCCQRREDIEDDVPDDGPKGREP